MSVKYFCDICKNELKPNEGERSSSFKHYKKVFTFDPKHQKQEGTREITILLCGDCTDKVRKEIDKIGVEESMKGSEMEIIEAKKK